MKDHIAVPVTTVLKEMVPLAQISTSVSSECALITLCALIQSDHFHATVASVLPATQSIHARIGSISVITNLSQN